MAREADHLQISALTSGFRVKTTVAYLDASPSAVPTLPDGDDGDVTDSLVHLLYRPGHYDIVQPRVGK